MLIANIAASSLSQNFMWPNSPSISVSSGNDLVSSGKKPLPEPVLTKIHDNMWHHQATMS